MAITDLTGTKWQLQDKFSKFKENTIEELFCSLKAEDVHGALLEYDFTKFGTFPMRPTSPSFFLEGWTTVDSTIKTMSAVTDSHHGLCWSLNSNGYSVGMHMFHTPLIEITGGAGATDADVIAWFEANATQIVDPPQDWMYKFLNDSGLMRVFQKLKTVLDNKADTSAVPFVATYEQTTYADVTAAIDADRAIVVNFSNNKNLICVTYATYTAGQNVTLSGIYKADSEVALVTITLTPANAWSIAHTAMQERLGTATDGAFGLVKLNSEKSITMNTDGQLEVGGRLGQFPSTTGIYAPNNREPRNVLDYSFLMTDALGMDMSANRSLAVVSGYGLSCKSAAAGATEYHITNNYQNRIIAKLCENGYASRDEATSKIETIIPVVSVQIGGAAYTPDSSANSSTNDIIITVAETLNPDTAITSIRLFGKMQSYATMHLGNGVRSDAGGRSLVLGGGVSKTGSINDNCLVGNAIFSSGNGVAAFGRNHICRKNRGFFAGTGHDSTNAKSEGASAVGEYSYMDSNTAFAVGNGTSHTARSNAFEVTADGGIVLKSPNGTRFKFTVDDSGTLTATSI